MKRRTPWAQTSCVARCERAFARIEQDTALNAWCFVDPPSALEAADASDQRRRQGQTLGPLDGKLIALKANMAVANWPWDAGINGWRSVRADADAQLVRQLRKTGAVLLGLTAMDEAALGASGLGIRGPIRLPRDPDCSPGGSSGGAAVAVVAGHCDIALGTDTIGSVRIPAALCGLYGFKPAANSLSLHGIVPVHPAHDQPGPLTHSMQSLLDVWHSLSDRSNASVQPADLGQIPVVMLEEPALSLLPAVVREPYARSLHQLAGSDLRLIRLAQPRHQAQLAEAITLLRPARRALFALCEHALAGYWQSLAPARFGAGSVALQNMLAYGASLTADQLATLQQTLQGFTAAWTELLASLAGRGEPVALALPTTPVLEFRHAQGMPADIADWTALANITGWPALTLPTRQGTAGFGLQLVSATLDNLSLCTLGLEVSRYLLPGGDPDALRAADMQQELL